MPLDKYNNLNTSNYASAILCIIVAKYVGNEIQVHTAFSVLPQEVL